MTLHSIKKRFPRLIITIERKGKRLAQGQAGFKFRTCVPVPSPGAAPMLFNDSDGTVADHSSLPPLPLKLLSPEIHPQGKRVNYDPQATLPFPMSFTVSRS